MQHGLFAVHQADELGDAALIVELGLLGGAGALVGERDFQALVQKGHLTQALGHSVIAELGLGKNLGVGVEINFRAGLLGFAGARQPPGGLAALVGLLEDVTVAPDFQVEPVRERVHHRNAHTVQSARDFVALGVKLAAGVQLGHHHFGGGLAGAAVDVHRDAAPVVGDGDGVVVVDGDFDVRAVARQRLVHRVVHHFPDQVVQAGGRGRADVHRRALADRLQVAEDLNAGGVVVVPRRGGGCLAALLCLRGSFLPGFSCLGHFLPTPRVANSRAAGEKTRSVSRPAGSVSGTAGAGGRILYSNLRDAASEQAALAFLFWAPLGRLPNKLFYQIGG